VVVHVVDQKKRTIILGLVFIIARGIYIPPGSDSIEKVVIEKEDVKITYNLNKASKKAEVSIDVFIEPDLVEKLGNRSYIEKITELDCRVYSTVFFNETASEKLKELNPDYNPGDNPAEGYEVTKVIVLIKNKENHDILSKCTIAEPTIEDFEIKYY